MINLFDDPWRCRDSATVIIVVAVCFAATVVICWLFGLAGL